MFPTDYEKRLLGCAPDAAASSSPSDRFIPCRANNRWQVKFAENAQKDEEAPNYFKQPQNWQSANAKAVYTSLLKNVLLGETIEKVKLTVSDQSAPHHAQKGIFSYRAPVACDNSTSYSTSRSPLCLHSQKLLQTTSNREPFHTSHLPYKILEAPSLRDDFYLNLMDFSATNLLAVGLKEDVYVWNANTSRISHVCDAGEATSNTITAVSWDKTGTKIAVGTDHGYIAIWDTSTKKQLNELSGHSARVGSLAWNCDILSSGSADRTISQYDLRCVRLAQPPTRRLVGHLKEVCGLKWSPDKEYLASGGNDNKLFVWDMRSSKAFMSFTEHTAAVKAIAWSPHHRRLLSSGGGQGDHCIRHWNTLTGLAVKHVDTGSQVCNLAWSENSPELVSTHGYTGHEIIVWKYADMKQVAKLTGHTKRVLFLALSPDGETIATGAGDEKVYLWKVFQKPARPKKQESRLALYCTIR